MNPDRREFMGVLAGSALPIASEWKATRQAAPLVECDSAAAEPVRFAAAELQRYLERILGNPAPGKASSRPRILLREVKDEDLGDEGFEIASSSGILTISGAPAGVVYGTYEFLRRFGGCQFSGLGPDCEHVPRRESINVDTPRLRMKPKLWYRGYQFFYSEPVDLVIQRLDWMAKNGLNYVMFTPHHDDLTGADAPVDPVTGRPAGASHFLFTESWWKSKVQPEVLKRGLKLDFNHHNLFYWLPPHRYFARRPEWFPLIDGERTAEPRQLAMCTSNQEAVNTLIANFRRYLRDNPQVKTVGVIVEDGLGMCQCQDCVKDDVDPKDAFRPYRGYKYPDAENKSKALRYARLVNQVAREIRGEFPDVWVGHAAYVDTQWPPRGLSLEPNVVTWVAVFWRDASQPLAIDSPAPANRFFMDILQQWRAVHPGRLIAYEYYMGMEVQKSLPYPMSEMICRDWPNLKKLGIGGATIQSWSANHNAYGLNNLAFARNGWEEQVDHAALLEGYLLGMFGSAAPDIRPVFERLIRALQKVEKEGPAASRWLSRYDAKSTTGGSFLPDAYTVVYLLEQLGPDFLDQAIQRARKNAAGGRERRQVELFGAVTSYWKKAAEPLSLDLKARQAEAEGKRVEAAAMLEEAADKCESIAAYLNTLPTPGWVSVATPGMWMRLPPQFRTRAAALRQA